MNPRVEALFHQMVDLPPETRPDFFARHDVDEETRREVEALLAFAPGASALLFRQVGAAAGRALPQLEAGSWRCGPYRLLSPIGHGGMGVVWLAERSDGRFERRTAKAQEA